MTRAGAQKRDARRSREGDGRASRRSRRRAEGRRSEGERSEGERRKRQRSEASDAKRRRTKEASDAKGRRKPSSPSEASGAKPRASVRAAKGRAATLQASAPCGRLALSTLRANLTASSELHRRIDAAAGNNHVSRGFQGALRSGRGRRARHRCRARHESLKLLRGWHITDNGQRPRPKRWSCGASAWQRAQSGRGPRCSICPLGETTRYSQSPPTAS